MALLHEIINYIVSIISHFWYFWIFIWIFLESSFFPFPSEIIIIPAWYLASKWEMNLYLIIFIWIIGSITWSLLNYFIALKLWNKVLLKIISQEKLDKLNNFFKNHWEISTFNGRLIPWLRQYISFPAGLANMHIKKFILYTWLGAWIWIIILALLWYFLWTNQELIHKYLKQITIITLAFILILSLIYIIYIKKRKNAK